ncbi:MAG TPA: PKD domain-containing protein [Anaerolineales bacterium]|nr:PKD domain-containing protein [Anaerolineales bacterium]
MSLRKLAVLCVVGGIAIPFSALAQANLEISVTQAVSCAEVSFDVGVSGGSPPYTFEWDFGDSETPVEHVVALPYLTSHTYPGAGEYAWSLNVVDGIGGAATEQGVVIIPGPTVTLSSDPFPPLLTLNEGSAMASFTADASGGVPPYTYTWDLNGDGDPDAGADPSSNLGDFTYAEAGKYVASVTVQDGCGLSATDTLPVLVIDPQDGEVCHPMAQRIADAVDTLFPDQAQDLYTCEDIFSYFEGGLTGSQLGFGRMWHAYKLALTIDDLSWEEILDWHLNGFGWGLLVQLDKFANALAEVSVSDLMSRVMSGENSIGDIRTAVRAATKYDTDMEDALARLAAGASPGELSQFYKTAAELGVDPAELDGYLDAGVRLPELRHAASLADRSGADWTDVVGAHTDGHSWGEIAQAYRLADNEIDAATILEEGSQEYRRQLHQETQSTRQVEQDQHTAANLSRQFGVSQDEILQLFNGECNRDWGCVRSHFRQQTGNPNSDGDENTAAQIAEKYGVDAGEVWVMFNGTCQQDWGCVREHFRNQSQSKPGKGHP